MVINAKPNLPLMLSAAVALSTDQAAACILSEPFDPSLAVGSTVVVGRFDHYRIVVDQKARDDDLRTFLATLKWSYLERCFSRPGRHNGDYVVFDIAVDETLSGAPARRLTATWTSWKQPDSPPIGRHLIALHPPAAEHWSKPPEPNLLTVLGDMCGPDYVFAAGSEQAKAIRAALRNPRPAPLIPAPPPDNAGRRPEWAGRFSAAQIAQFYPAKARTDQVEGSATLDCIALKSGGVTDCKVLSEAPRGYGIGEAAVLLLHTHGRLKPGTFRAGDTVRTTWRWQLD